MALPWEGPDYVHAEAVEQVAEGMKLYTFPDGFQCYTPSSDVETEFIYNEIMVKRIYLPAGIELSEAGCVIDVGANIGLFTLFVKSLNPAVRIFAFEPIPENFAALERNVKLHGLEGVQLFQTAIGSSGSAQRQFTYYPHMTGNSTARPKLKANLREEFVGIFGAAGTDRYFESQPRFAPVRTLSSLLDAAQITQVDLLKIDTEGDEVEVLAGIEPRHRHLFHQVVAEVQHGSLLPDFEAQVHALGLEIWSEPGLVYIEGASQVYARRGGRVTPKQ